MNQTETEKFIPMDDLNFELDDIENDLKKINERNSKRGPKKQKPKDKIFIKKGPKTFTYDKIMTKAEELKKNGKEVEFVHISTYKFVPIEDPKSFREELKEKTKEIVGTILVGKEGINLFLSGLKEDAQKFKDYLSSKKDFSDCWWKISPCKELAYRKDARVRLKKEIVTMGIEDMDPLKETAPYLQPKELAKWMDEGKDIVILDTRNDYEYRMGTFKNAKLLPMKNFKQFPDLMDKTEIDKEKIVVSFCTGGIRCEKGAPMLKRKGFKNTYQLEGGILKFFNDLKDDAQKYWDGECFVFDRRVGVDFNWNPTKSVLCFVCREPLSEKEQESKDYKQGVSCPYCINKTKEEIEKELELRQKGE